MPQPAPLTIPTATPPTVASDPPSASPTMSASDATVSPSDTNTLVDQLEHSVSPDVADQIIVVDTPPDSDESVLTPEPTLPTVDQQGNSSVPNPLTISTTPTFSSPSPPQTPLTPPASSSPIIPLPPVQNKISLTESDTSLTASTPATPAVSSTTSPEVTAADVSPSAAQVTATNVAQATTAVSESTASDTTTSTTTPAASPPPPPAATTTDPTANKTYVNLLDVLVDQGVITHDQSTDLLTQSIKENKSIDVVVDESHLVSEEPMAQAKAIFYKVPYVRLNEVGIYPEALSLLPESAARHYGMLPFSLNKDDNTLSVAMRNPLDVTAVHFVEQKTGKRVISYYAAQSEIERLIAEHYSENLSTEVSEAVEQSQAIEKKQLDFSDLSGKTIREAPVTKIVQTILSFALKTRASDVHIEPQEQRTRVRYRIDGILQEKLILPKSVHNAVVSRIKILSGLKIDERRLPQDGRFDFTEREMDVDLRVSTLPTVHGEKVVMRLLKKNAQVPSLEELGLNGLALRNMRDAIKVPHGIILVTGPTGSGKTTTLYSVLHAINTPKVNIMTLEDPVEYMMTGVNQVQVNPQAGLTFASGLRSFLRQDPNIIMVGEIRDSETADLAVQASLTGHLVFSTLHTSSAAGSLPRLMDMGAEPFLLASSMTLVVAQRIARVINPEYKESYKPEAEVVSNIAEVLGERFESWLKEHNMTRETLVLYRAKKERPEVEPEYKGRVAIFEVMPISETIAKLILARKPGGDLEKAAIAEGMLLMKQDGYLKVLEGLTTIEEVLRVAEI